MKYAVMVYTGQQYECFEVCDTREYAEYLVSELDMFSHVYIVELPEDVWGKYV